MEPFIYLPEYPFAFCTQCRIGFVASEIVHHIKVKHSTKTRQETKRIAQKVAAIPGIAKNQDDLKNWILPPPTIQINPYIQAPRDDGLGCSHCQYVVRDKQQMQKHGRTEHGWVSRRKRGGQQQAVPDEQDAMLAVPWRDHVQCQQVCNWGHGKRWFEVGRNDERATQEEATDGEGDADHEANVAFFNMVQEEGRKAFEDEASGRRVQDIDDKNEAHQWLGRCGWPRHLEGIRIDRLRTLLEPISDDEPVLQRMWEVLESVMDAAYQATARQCYPGTAELFEIARKEAHMTTTKPFQGLMEPDAWVRYKSWWKQLLCIWKRYDEWDAEDGYDNERFSNGGSSSSSSDSDSDTDTDSNSNRSAYDDDAVSRRYGPSDPRPPYKMTIQQEELWKAFDNGIRQVVTGADRAGRYTADRLQRSCLDAMVQFFDHPLKSGNHYESIVISALAVMGLDEGGGWKPVENYTSIYPAVIKVARYLVLYQSMLERQAQIDQLAQYATIRQAEEEAEGLFRIVRRKVRRFMIRIPEGEDIEPSPMNWIINTRTYGMHIRYSMPGSEMIEWHGDPISCNRVKIKMSEISDMLHAFIGDARQTIEDRHGESALEHSFLQDEANQSWVIKGDRWVQKQVAASKAKMEAWIAKPHNEACPYREEAIRRYSRLIEEFRSQLFVAMHMLGGQPARSTEILGIRMWNTMNGGVRNIFIHDGMVCFVTMYHKGFRQSGKVKVIHRYLPREINISMWRHMAIAISNRYLNKAFGEIDAGGGGDDDDDGGEDSLVDSIHDLQAGHGSHIAGLIYARLFGQGDLSTMNRRDGFRKVSMQWHRFFGFGAEDRVEQLGTKRPLQQGVPTDDDADRGDIAGFRRTRDLFDGNVEAEGRDGVVQGYAVRAGEGKDVSRSDRAEEYRVQGRGD
ncbi:uncharacterized protein FPOAC1_014077 [Fusarium poae]|uniref:uncharacterized protein n=1 Tax=Fusarium poae TaxID=36050 RepID=UPI001D053EFE|nr:uncharacterized protein FPOAC1_014077 [Fusarium poae]KAG8664108.1 hypothetical protein FPOAC1_014077 [Fusarium poae]